MRFIDIAAGSAIALLCLALIAYQDPTLTRSRSAKVIADARAGMVVAGYVEKVGLPFLGSSDFGAICASFESFSNSSVTLTGDVDGVRCSAPLRPSTYLGNATMSLDVAGKRLKIQGWILAEVQ
jgi:hypothetical protein